ncbi:MAG: TolC family protein [Burkholderiaceae bacterium]|nr:TolC family protein [Rhodoferax sp.]MCB2032556.1 TolC family protein [Ottowia sp.]MCP5257864.1 TolC family protein [Burkholderiaceae bacterium]
MRAGHAQWEAARASLRLAQTEGLPTLDFNLAHYRNGRPNTAISDLRSHENVIGMSLSISLFDGFATTCRVRAAQAQVAEHGTESAPAWTVRWKRTVLEGVRLCQRALLHRESSRVGQRRLALVPKWD